jgi:ubiquinone/menaquinone biosynthesis C-methylase UbiE
VKPFSPEENWLLPHLNARKGLQLAELGCGDGERAAWLLERLPPEAAYWGFDSHTARAEAAALRLSSFAGRGKVERRDPAFLLPLAPASQDAFLLLDLLENLRMDQLYMALSEARRTLRAGGLLFLRCKATLEPRHYISPEDWKILQETKIDRDGVSREALVLERLG